VAALLALHALPLAAQEAPRNFWDLREPAHTEAQVLGDAPATAERPPLIDPSAAAPSTGPAPPAEQAPSAESAAPAVPVAPAESGRGSAGASAAATEQPAAVGSAAAQSAPPASGSPSTATEPAAAPPVAPEAGLSAGVPAEGAPSAAPATGATAPAEPPAPAEPEPRSLDALYRLGDRARRAGDAGAAKRHFRDVLRQAPYHYLSLVALGRLHLSDDPSLARSYLETARQVHPSSEDVHYLLGQVYERQGRELDAAEAYRRTIYLNPRHYDANSRLRAVLRRMRAGRSVVERAAESFYQHPSLASLTLFGRIVMEQVEPRQAVLEFEEVKRRQPELPEAELWLARAYHAALDPDAEISAYRRYLEQRPQAIGVRLTLVERLAGQGWYVDATGYLQPFDSQEQGPAEHLPPSTFARVTFLRSRLLSAGREPGRAGEMLLLAHERGTAQAEVEAAFAEDLALYPESPELWFAYGNWLRATERNAQATEALVQAGRMDATQRRTARDLLRRMRATNVATVAATLALGELAWVEQDADTALRLLAEVPVGHPLDHQASLLRGLIHRERGQLEPALDAFMRYVLFFEDARDLVYARGNVFWALGRTEEALAVWREHPDVLLRHPQVLLRVAEHHRRMGDAPAEIAARERLLAVLPANAANRFRLGELYELQGRRMEAVLLWERLLGDRPRDPDLLARVGRGWLALGDSARALPLLQRASQLQALDAETSTLLARELYRARQYEAALRVYWSLYGLQPEHPEVQRILPELVLNLPATAQQRAVAAGLASKAGRLDVAAELLETQLNAAPHDNDTRLALAEIYLRQDRPARAEAVLNAPEATAGSDDAGLRLMATVQRRLGRKAALAETLARLRSTQAGDAALLREHALLLAELRRPAEARPLLEQALAAQADDVPVRMALADAANAQGDAAAAELHLRRVLAAHPAHDEARRRLIELLLKREQWEEAAGQLERWVADHPQDAGARYNLITAYLKLFRNEAAGPHFRALQGIQPLRARPLEPYFR
jgi:tetratricopeptide (TPR) repeat protein